MVIMIKDLERARQSFGINSAASSMCCWEQWP